MMIAVFNNKELHIYKSLHELLNLSFTIHGDHEFLMHRVGNKKPQQLNKVFPGSNYGDSEVGRKDQFDKAFGETAAWYCGKDYPNKATEILSMGIQIMKDDPGVFFAKDPEYAKFIMTVLQYKSVHEKMRKRGEA
jgi:hypothetical protein